MGETASLADIGVTGLAVMGSSLARNLGRNGFRVAVHNRTGAKTDEFMAEYGSEGDFLPTHDSPEFVSLLARPRKALIMVKAGEPTDAVIADLVRLMEPGDIILDGGNSLYTDTIRREALVKSHGIRYLGVGVSGGEEGALNGPAIMPGGDAEAYREVAPILTQIAAQVDGEPCCTYIGPDGAGHFVKMVHNGIEYADMQLIAEAYDLMRLALGMSAPEIGEVFAEWNKGELNSYLIEITAEVLSHLDGRTGKPFVDIVLDHAEQKGTGKWTVQNALDIGVPSTVIAEATFARGLSGDVAERAAAVKLLPALARPWDIAAGDRAAFIEDIRQALYASKITAYSQGFEQIARASRDFGWGIDLSGVARIWRGGCIIRAAFLNPVSEAFAGNPELPLLIVAPFFAEALTKGIPAWRRVVAAAATHGVPAPAFSSALAYYDGVRAPRLPAALVQAQRDYFGAHTYERVDGPGKFHTLWGGNGTEIPA
ncbi:MAG: NADP-dependent phosphogluconate dehydrogenase [Promicromonosporaceae bacterium]|nr:NADP-dependent phosphogluconate dehydrogenase [Promicromonosporaceae bacterium]